MSSPLYQAQKYKQNLDKTLINDLLADVFANISCEEHVCVTVLIEGDLFWMGGVGVGGILIYLKGSDQQWHL